MTRTRMRDLFAGTVAAAALLTIVVGVPVALIVAVGWPLPHALPTVTQFSRALTGKDTVDSSVWVRLIACAIWLAWMRVSAVVVSEVAATATGRLRQATHRNALHVGVGQLVATAALLLTVATTRHAPFVPLRPIATVTSTELLRPTTVAAPVVSRPAAAPAKQWVVSRRETLWGIAEHTLGDGARYREIYDLNVDRPQTDGSRLTNPERLHAGWTLTLPDDATNVASITPDTEVTVEPGDTLSAIARRELGDADRYPELFADNVGRRQPDGTALHDPNLIRPGWQLEIPTPAALTSTEPAPPPPPPPAVIPPPATQPSLPAPGPSPSTAGPPLPSTALADDAPPNPHAGGATIPVALLGGGLSAATAAAIVWRLRRLRNGRARRRRPGAAPPASDDNSITVERNLAGIADEETARWLSVANRCLVAALGVLDDPPIPVLLRVGRRGVEVLLDRPAPPAGRFIADDDPTAWRLDPNVELDELDDHAGQIPAVCALITIGTTPEGPVLLNLEHAARLSVTGDPQPVRDFLVGVALELGTAPWSDTSLKLLEGIDLDPTGLTLTRTAVDEPSALRTITDNYANTSTSLAHRDTLTARTRADAPELWSPTVALLGTPTEEPRRTVELRSHRGSVVLAAGPIDGAGWQLHLTDDGLAHLAPLGLVLSAVGVDAITGTHTADLLAAHAQPSVENDRSELADIDRQPALPETPSTTNGNGNGHRHDDRNFGEQLTAILAPRPVEVTILTATPIVTGWADDEGLRNKSTEIVVFLALADRPVPTERLLRLWHGDIAPATFKSAIARTRTALGDDADGARHFPDAPDGQYSLGPNVGCDWQRFTALTRIAAHAAPADAIAALTAALELVQGRPFTRIPPRGHYRWVEIDNFLYNIEAVITDTAHRLAVLAMDAGDPDLATWATTQGHLVTPGQMSLFEDRLTARGMAGDLDGVRLAFDQACRSVEEVDPLDQLPESTARAYETALRLAGAAEQRDSLRS